MVQASDKVLFTENSYLTYTAINTNVRNIRREAHRLDVDCRDGTRNRKSFMVLDEVLTVAGETCSVDI